MAPLPCLSLPPALLGRSCPGYETWIRCSLSALSYAFSALPSAPVSPTWIMVGTSAHITQLGFDITIRMSDALGRVSKANKARVCLHYKAESVLGGTKNSWLKSISQQPQNDGLLVWPCIHPAADKRLVDCTLGASDNNSLATAQREPLVEPATAQCHSMGKASGEHPALE